MHAEMSSHVWTSIDKYNRWDLKYFFGIDIIFTDPRQELSMISGIREYYDYVADEVLKFFSTPALRAAGGILTT